MLIDKSAIHYPSYVCLQHQNESPDTNHNIDLHLNNQTMQRSIFIALVLIVVQAMGGVRFIEPMFILILELWAMFNISRILQV